MTAEITKKDQALLEEWNQLKPKQEEYQTFNEIKLDNLKINEDGQINPNFGKLFAYNDEGVLEIDIKNAQFVPLKTRVQINGKWNDKLERRDFYCLESDDFEIGVYDTQSKELIENGNFFELRKKYELTSTDVLYVVYKNKIYRWKMIVGGYEIVNKLKKMISSFNMPITFKVTEIITRKTGDRFYNELVFERGVEVSIGKTIDAIKKLNEFLYTGKKEELIEEAEIKQIDNKSDKLKEEADKLFSEVENTPKQESKTDISDVPF